MHEQVLRFWFAEIVPEQWWSADPAFDEQVRTRFGTLLARASQGELSDWRDTPRGRLAELVVLDQFSRNVHRGTPRAFAQDAMALVLAQEALRANAERSLSPIETGFLLLPFMHSESAAIHVQAERLFRELAPDDNYQFELRHKAIIDRFGRYPHRNAILGRESTPEERAFLEQPGSRF